MLTSVKTMNPATKLRLLNACRVLAGLLAMTGILAAIVLGLMAFTQGADSWQPMKFPLTAAMILLWTFGRCATAINALAPRISPS